jgi:hypothetical protein
MTEEAYRSPPAGSQTATVAGATVRPSTSCSRRRTSVRSATSTIVRPNCSTTLPASVAAAVEPPVHRVAHPVPAPAFADHLASLTVATPPEGVLDALVDRLSTDP